MTTKQANRIINEICARTNIDVGKLKSTSRKREIIDARRAFMKVFSLEGMTSTQIGKIFNKDHASVLHSNKVHKDRCDVNDKDYVKMYERVKREYYFTSVSIDNSMQSLLDIISAENEIRHNEFLTLKKENMWLKNKIAKYEKENN